MVEKYVKSVGQSNLWFPFSYIPFNFLGMLLSWFNIERITDYLFDSKRYHDHQKFPWFGYSQLKAFAHFPVSEEFFFP